MEMNLIQMMRNTKAFQFPGVFFSLPEYDGWQAEQMSWHETICIGDWSFAPWGVLEGPEATKLLQDYSINSFANAPIGQVKHLVGCTESGKTVAEGILMRAGEQRYLISTLPWWQYIASLGKYDATYTPEVPGSTTLYQVCGPNSLYLVEEVSGQSLRDLRFMRYRDIAINGHEVLCTNGLTMSGEIGFELHFSSEYKDEIMGVLLEAGAKYGACRLGSRTSMQHIEAAFPTMGFQYLPAIVDFSDELVRGFGEYITQSVLANEAQMKLAGSFEATDISEHFFSPVELGWANHIKFDHDFRGRAALETEAASPHRKLVTLEFDKDDVVDVYASLFDEGETYGFIDVPIRGFFMTVQNDKVLVDGKLAGISTTPFYSYYFRRTIALAVVDVNLELGSRVEVVWGDPGTRQKTIRATVKPAPYKPDKRRTPLDSLPLTFPGI
ncbi:MAG: hypothetical protein LBL27_03585 [Coriobacteriales bacterium]|jgi:vanillate/3-O-methylgallate O-demethylase|nr:hypothetical protein [Coriobacteriales bacterium]